MAVMEQVTPLGRQIEADSFAIIDQEAAAHGHPPDDWQVVRRIIHATADFEFAQTLWFSPGAVTAGMAALRSGCPLVVDVKMISAGLNENRLAAYGCRTHCFISDADVIARAQAANSTRAAESMVKAHNLGLLDGALVAVGNAPTSLLTLARLVRDEGAKPALVLAVPVGFVSAVESKEAAMAMGLPVIAARGRKGGTPVAVAAIHALLALAAQQQPPEGA